MRDYTPGGAPRAPDEVSGGLRWHSCYLRLLSSSLLGICTLGFRRGFS